MSFTVNDFHDLVQLLQEHPDWRDELRRVSLTDDLLAMPDSMRKLTDRVGDLAEAQVRTEARLESLAEAQVRTEARLESLAEAQARTEVVLTSLAAKVDQLVDVVSKLTGEQPGIKGFITEARYEKKAHAYFAPIARHLRVLGPPDLDRILDAGEASGALTEAEADQIRLTDIVARGKRRENGAEVILVIEASWVVDKDDVERARDRARLLAQTGVMTIPVVAGEAIESSAGQIAHDLGAWQVTDGKVIPPKPPPQIKGRGL